ncbi:MAG: hypothetical protein JW816_00435 [Candidatus Buchananbacteria bacterium]|nr:hypothetical protein [Candidatus Buchananbacteria bacterium]
MEKDIINYNWQRSHTRELSLFTMEIASYGYVVLLEKILGIGYSHILNIFQNGLEFSYRDKEDDFRLVELFFKVNQSKLLSAFEKESKRVLLDGDKMVNLLSSSDSFVVNDTIKILPQIHEVYAGVAAVLGITRPAGIFYEQEGDKRNGMVERYGKIRFDQAKLYDAIEQSLDIFFNHLSSLLKIKSDFLRYCTAGELTQLCMENLVVTVKEMAERKKISILYYSKEQIKIWYGLEALELKLQIDKKDEAGLGTMLKGKIAHPGIVRGHVRVVLKKKDLELIEKGDILITPMTQVYFMPYLSKVSAIVTDEGGITCHAAIIARELKIPCVIAAKNATKFFKAGDLIEVNANIGIIKKI